MCSFFCVLLRFVFWFMRPRVRKKSYSAGNILDLTVWLPIFHSKENVVVC